MKDNIKAIKVRDKNDEDGNILCGIEFLETLSEYSNRTKDRYFIVLSSLSLLFISLFIILMRVESVIYFNFNKIMYLYSIIAAVFLLCRYLFGALYKPVPL
ncbi:glycosyltransferase family 2 protein, partial [Clostridium sp. HCS.1]